MNLKIWIPVLCLLPAFAFAQSPKSINIVKLDAVPVIDGSLDDAVWKEAARAGDFVTSGPVYGLEPGGATEVHMFYGRDALYIAAECRNPEGVAVRTDLGTRDDLGTSDQFSVWLDTWNDDRNTFRFSVSAAGAQYDSYGEGAWNSNWQSAVAVQANSWTLEMRIPFSSLRFPQRMDQSWGLQFTRYLFNTGENSAWSPINPQVNNLVLQFGDLTGLQGLHQGPRKSVEASSSTNLDRLAVGSSDPLRVASYVGLDGRVGLGSASTLDFTILPQTGYYYSTGLQDGAFQVGGNLDTDRQFNTEGSTTLAPTYAPIDQPNIGSDIWSTSLDLIGSNYVIGYRPGQSIQATKFTTRTPQKLGILVYNNILGPTKANLVEPSSGKQISNVILQPLSNHNVVALDMPLRYGGWAAVSNQNVFATPGASTNLLKANFRVNNRANSFGTWGGYSWNRLENHFGSGVSNNRSYNLGFGRINQRFNWNVNQGWNDNAVLSGLNASASTSGQLQWNNFTPKGRFLRTSHNIGAYYFWSKAAGNTYANITGGVAGLDRRYQSWYANLNVSPFASKTVYSIADSLSYTHRTAPGLAWYASYNSDFRKRWQWSLQLNAASSLKHENVAYASNASVSCIVTRNLRVGSSLYVRFGGNNFGQSFPSDQFIHYNETNLGGSLYANWYVNTNLLVFGKFNMNYYKKHISQAYMLSTGGTLEQIQFDPYTPFGNATTSGGLQWMFRPSSFLKLQCNLNGRNTGDFFNQTIKEEVINLGINWLFGTI